MELVPSPNYDLSQAKTKPVPRLPVDPTYRGWKEVGGWEHDDVLTPEDESIDLLSKTSVYDNLLPPILYGDWYHNVGFLIVGGLLSWIIGWFRFSLAPLFFVVIAFSILYRASVRKYRTSLRHLAQREFTVRQIENDYETMDWLNIFLEKFWYFLEPSISQIVCDQVNPILASSPAPAFIKKLWIDSFTAGTKPPRIDFVKTLQGTDDDVVVMDWNCSFTPNNLTDSNGKQMKNNVNQKIVVKAELFGIPIPVSVSDVSFRSSVRVRMRMMSAFPHIETINVTLLEAPEFDFNCQLFGDSIFNSEVLNFPGLYPLINQMVKKYAGPMLFTPISFQLNVQQLMAGHSLNSAIGVMGVTVKSAKGLKSFANIGGTLDPYLTMGFNKEILAQTPAKSSTRSPVWNQTFYFPICSLSEPLEINVFDKNKTIADTMFGGIQLDLYLMRDNKKQDFTSSFIRNNKVVGELLYSLQFMPTIEAQRQPDGAVIPPPDLNTGIALINVAAAKRLRGPKPDTPPNTYVELWVNNELASTSKTFKKNANPSYGVSKELIIEHRAKSRVKLVLKNSDNDKVMGTIRSTLNNLIDGTQVDQTWQPFANGGEVQILTSWKPVELDYVTSTGGYTPPIGVVRVGIKKAEDLRNLETIGKVDPYVRLLVNGIQRGRTAAADSTLNPTWNEVHYITVSSPNQKLNIEVMDVEAHSPDRTLGSFNVGLSEIIHRDDKGKYIEYFDSEDREGKLIHKKGPKGVVTYDLAFFPVLPVMSLEDLKDEEIAKAKEEELKKKKAAELEKLGGKSKSPSPEATEEVEDFVDTSKAHLSLEELIEYSSGVLVFEFSNIQLVKDGCYLQAFFDTHGHPDYVSQKFKTKRLNVGTTGDAIVNELGWSTALFRLVKKEDSNRADKCLTEVSIPTMQLLKNGYHKPMTLDLNGSKIQIQVQWIPILYATSFPAQDSFKNCGVLTAEVLRAQNLIASDSNGKSDPYIKLFLNSEKEDFLKTKTVKKDLNPTWNTSETVKVFNLHDATIKVLCMDWDMADDDDLLGTGYVAMKNVKMGEEVAVPLVSEDEGDGGVAYLRFSFKELMLLNVRANTTTPFGVASGVGIGAVKGVGKGVEGVGKVGKGIGGVLLKPFGKKDKD